MLRSLARILGKPLRVVPHAAHADAIVVLGAPLRADGTLSSVLAERVAAGVALFHAGRAPLLVMSGGKGTFVRAEGTEAAAMARVALASGVPAAALVVEDRSSNTSRNAFATAELLAGRGVRSVIVVTQPFHLRRSILWFSRAGFEASGHVIRGGLQDQLPSRALRWIGKEYLSLARDLLVTRKPGG